MNEFDIDHLPGLFPAFSEHQILFYAGACAAALESQQHISGTVFRLEGEFPGILPVYWNKKIPGVKLSEPRDLAEFGAIALAFYIAATFSEYDIIEQSVIGNGFDYWLGYKTTDPKYDPDNFLNARLEVSGILKGNGSDVAARLRQKIRQTGVSDYLNIPAMIIIVEFSTPFSVIFVK